MTITLAEVSVVAGAFFLFSFLPGVFAWAESLRRRRAEAAALSIAAPSLGAAPPTPAGAPEIVEAPAETVAAEQPDALPTTEPLAAASPPVAQETMPPAEDQGPHTFRLDDLRHARALETPPRAVLDDPAAQQQWEEGLQLAEKKHAAAVGGASLSTSFEPQARCFAGMRDLGEGVKQLRFFLFPDLWPTSTEQAVGEAVFEVAEAGLLKAWVVRREA